MEVVRRQKHTKLLCREHESSRVVVAEEVGGWIENNPSAMCVKTQLYGLEGSDSEYLREDFLVLECLGEHNKQHEFPVGDQLWKIPAEALAGRSQIVEWFRWRCCEHLQQALPL